MPTYDYRCTVCGHEFEHFQSMFDEHLKSCTKCGSEVRRVISGGTGLIFKGSGFYITDYKNKSSNASSSTSGSKKPASNKTVAETSNKTSSSDTKSDKK